MFDCATTTSLDDIRNRPVPKMYSSTIINPCRCMEYSEHRARVAVGQDSRDRGDVTIAEVAGIVANLNEKVHLLRKEILELKDLGSISVCCTSTFEENKPLGSLSASKRPKQSWGHRFLGRVPSLTFFKKKLWTNACNEYKCRSRSPTPCTCTLYHVGTETKIVNGRREENERISPNNNEDRESGSGSGSGSEPTNTSSDNCSSDDSWCKIKCGKNRKRISSDKSTYAEPEKSNKRINTKCYGRRVRKRISRGVQTLPNKKLRFSRVNRKIRNLWKLKWHSRRSCGKEGGNCRAAISATSHAELQNDDAIYKSPRYINKTKATIPDTKSDNVKSAVKPDKQAEEKPGQVNRSDVTKKNYKRKYDFSVDGMDVEIVRVGNGNPGVIKKSGTKSSPETPITGRIERSKSKEKPGTVATKNDRNLSSPVGGTRKTGKTNDAKRNDIADVKKRLDDCIADLNDIISNLSKGFHKDPTPGGPAGEGPEPKNMNSAPRARSRHR